jgi:hypothetical protein
MNCDVTAEVERCVAEDLVYEVALLDGHDVLP